MRCPISERRRGAGDVTRYLVHVGEAADNGRLALQQTDAHAHELRDGAAGVVLLDAEVAVEERHAQLEQVAVLEVEARAKGVRAEDLLPLEGLAQHEVDEGEDAQAPCARQVARQRRARGLR